MSSSTAYIATTASSRDRAATLSKDYQVLEALLASGKQEEARKLYESGAYCQSYAELALTEATTLQIPDSVWVASRNGVGGYTFSSVLPGSKMLRVQYVTESNADMSELCSVGSVSPQLDHCFSAAGVLEIDGSSYDYGGYIASANTFNGLSLQKLSTDTPLTSHPTYKIYVGYYGNSTDYADKWVQAAFDRQKMPDLKVDFSAMPAEGASKAISLGSLVLNVWMYVLQKMEQALQECTPGTAVISVPQWDEAIDSYRGIGGAPDGSLGQLEALAEAYCAKFGTCDGFGSATVNRKLTSYWNNGKNFLLNGQCDLVKSLVYDRIVAQMAVPLIQGLLFHAYELDIYEEQRATVKAEAATFSAALMPLLNECGEGFAQLIHSNVVIDDGTTGHSTSFEVIKGALERHYACLGVTCADVGGIVNTASPNEYLYNANPCGSGGSSKYDNSGQARGSLRKHGSSDIGSAMIVIVVGLVGVAAAILARTLRRRCAACRKGKQDFHSDQSNGDGTSSATTNDGCERLDAEIL